MLGESVGERERGGERLGRELADADVQREEEAETVSVPVCVGVRVAKNVTVREMGKTLEDDERLGDSDAEGERVPEDDTERDREPEVLRVSAPLAEGELDARADADTERVTERVVQLEEEPERERVGELLVDGVRVKDRVTQGEADAESLRLGDVEEERHLVTLREMDEDAELDTDLDGVGDTEPLRVSDGEPLGESDAEVLRDAVKDERAERDSKERDALCVALTESDVEALTEGLSVPKSDELSESVALALPEVDTDWLCDDDADTDRVGCDDCDSDGDCAALGDADGEPVWRRVRVGLGECDAGRVARSEAEGRDDAEGHADTVLERDATDGEAVDEGSDAVANARGVTLTVGLCDSDGDDDTEAQGDSRDDLEGVRDADTDAESEEEELSRDARLAEATEDRERDCLEDDEGDARGKLDEDGESEVLTLLDVLSVKEARLDPLGVRVTEGEEEGDAERLACDTDAPLVRDMRTEADRDGTISEGAAVRLVDSDDESVVLGLRETIVAVGRVVREREECGELVMDVDAVLDREGAAEVDGALVVDPVAVVVLERVALWVPLGVTRMGVRDGDAAKELVGVDVTDAAVVREPVADSDVDTESERDADEVPHRVKLVDRDAEMETERLVIADRVCDADTEGLRDGGRDEEGRWEREGLTEGDALLVVRSDAENDLETVVERLPLPLPLGQPVGLTDSVAERERDGELLVEGDAVVDSEAVGRKEGLFPVEPVRTTEEEKSTDSEMRGDTEGLTDRDDDDDRDAEPEEVGNLEGVWIKEPVAAAAVPEGPSLTDFCAVAVVRGERDTVTDMLADLDGDVDLLSLKAPDADRTTDAELPGERDGTT